MGASAEARRQVSLSNLPQKYGTEQYVSSFIPSRPPDGINLLQTNAHHYFRKKKRQFGVAIYLVSCLLEVFCWLGDYSDISLFKRVWL